ncbi:MAG: hypothetical protein WD981_01985 [Gaiellaceae bacterium]
MQARAWTIAVFIAGMVAGGALLGGTFPRGEVAQALPQAAAAAPSPVGDDIRALQEKQKAFGTVGGQPSEIDNLGDLRRAIELEAAKIARDSARDPREGPGVHADDIERLNAKLELYRGWGGDPAALEDVRRDLERAIEEELRRLRRSDEGRR